MFKFFSKKKHHEQVNENITQVEQKPFGIEDIVDEDMMVAAIVASIDFREEVQTNVRVVSIKQLN